MILLMGTWTFFVPFFKGSDGSLPIYFYAICFLFDAINGSLTFSIYVASGSFFAQISDPNVGGTYLTLLKTITNFGKCF